LKSSIFSLCYSKEKSGLFDKEFRLKQIFDFIFQKKVFDFQKMSNLPKELQISLESNFNIISLKKKDQKESIDNTVKYLFELEDGNCIESVLLVDENQRYTFCISTQVGCKLNCSFCMTGKMGFIRNLNYFEIISQILFLAKEADKSFNIVFMGMGEPLLNFTELSKAINILTDKAYFNISQTRITVSTSGIAEKIPELFLTFPKINLAVSINSFIQNKREKIMPVSKMFPLKDLFNILYECSKKYKTRITLEFVLIKDFNDGDDEIKEIRKIKPDIFLINIIPLNNKTGDGKPDEKKINYFCNALENAGFQVTRRYRRGEDIQASCGMLYWENKLSS